MPLRSLFRAWVLAQVALLGHDSFAVREAASARLDNPIAALLLPESDPDPEVNFRLRGIAARNLRWTRAVFIERVVYRERYALWLDHYFLPGRNRIGDREAWEDLRFDFAGRMAELDRRWPLPRDEWIHVPHVPDWDEFRELLDYHRNVVPPPREK